MIGVLLDEVLVVLLGGIKLFQRLQRRHDRLVEHLGALELLDIRLGHALLLRLQEVAGGVDPQAVQVREGGLPCGRRESPREGARAHADPRGEVIDPHGALEVPEQPGLRLLNSVVVVRNVKP